MEEKKLIEFRNIVKNFDGQIVLKGVNLDIYENEFVTLLGPQRVRQDDPSADPGGIPGRG